MAAPHYAISEALIVLAALWVGWRLLKSGYFLGAAGSVLIGAAAAIGVYRFGTSRFDELAEIHRSVSQIGGATAMAMIALQFAMIRLDRVHATLRLVALVLIGGTLAAGLLVEGLTTSLFLGWAVLAVILSASLPALSMIRRVVCGAVLSLFLFNVLFVRQSAWLGANLSWHLFHILIALWLLGFWWVLSSMTPQKRGAAGEL